MLAKLVRLAEEFLSTTNDPTNIHQNQQDHRSKFLQGLESLEKASKI
jgi:hypothetical protein